ncbi:uncharacterized protein LOC134797285 [Cydia splendana]|uniref:uncharacterized protein LOC134797285 n=1 Tax=Cydia splendana TaxID=1100963 RepID=UPI00212E301A
MKAANKVHIKEEAEFAPETKCIKLEEVIVKNEISEHTTCNGDMDWKNRIVAGLSEAAQARLYEDQHVKNEFEQVRCNGDKDWMNSAVASISEVAKARLYEDHQVKDEVQARLYEDQHVKNEFEQVRCNEDKDWKNSAVASISEMARARLYEDHQVKDEVVVGPEVLLRQKSTFIECSFSRMHFFNIWHSDLRGASDYKRKRHMFKVLKSYFENTENIDFTGLERCVHNLCTNLRAYWNKVSRSKKTVLVKYAHWLNKVVTIRLPCYKMEQCTLEQNIASPSDPSSGCDRCRGKDIFEHRELLIDHKNSKETLSNTSFTNIVAEEMVDLVEKAKLTRQQYLVISKFFNNKFPDFLPTCKRVFKARIR